MLQSRYGYTDEYILSLPYSRFIQLVEISSSEKSNEYREEMKKLAFVGWQNYILQPMEKGQKHKNFKEYLVMIGLEEKSTSKVEDAEWEKKKKELTELAESMGRS